MIDERNAKKYCKEDISLIENYKEAIADKTQSWDIHHRGEILPCGNYSTATLKKYQLYYNRSASELIFLTHGEHRRLHNLNFSEETKKKMSESQSGQKNPLFGKHHSWLTRKKISQALSGEKSTVFGTHWYNDGVNSVRAKTCPEGFVAGRLPWMEKQDEIRTTV